MLVLTNDYWRKNTYRKYCRLGKGDTSKRSCLKKIDNVCCGKGYALKGDIKMNGTKFTEE